MTTMKKSLLEIVGEIEIEADGILTHAQERAEEEFAEIRATVANEKATIQKRATQTSASIIHEHVRLAEEEATQITEDAKRVAVRIHDNAAKNRERALLKARALFNTLYGTSL